VEVIDYSEIMQYIPQIQRKREDALRSEYWQTAVKLTIDILRIDSLLISCLIEKILAR
jgi:hypothetical protein